MISQNQDQFLQMLTEGTDLSAAGMDAGGEGGNPAEYISISPEENEAVNRVSSSRLLINYILAGRSWI